MRTARNTPHASRTAPAPSSSNHIPRRRRLVGLFVMLVLIPFLYGCWVLLPDILEQIVLPRIARRAEIELQASVEHFGLRGMSLRDITLQAKNQSFALTLEHAQLTWRITGLFRREIDTLSLERLDLTVLAPDPTQTVALRGYVGTAYRPFSIKRLQFDHARVHVASHPDSTPQPMASATLEGVSGTASLYYGRAPRTRHSGHMGGRVLLDGQPLGPFAVSFRPGASTLDIIGTLSPDAITPHPQPITWHGTLHYADIHRPYLDLAYEAKELQVDFASPILQRLMPLDELRPFVLFLSLTGKLSGTPGAMVAPIEAQAVVETIQSRDGRMRADGFYAELSSPDMFSGTTYPEQTVRLERLACDQHVISNAVAVYRLEHPAALFIEQGELAWHAGHIRVYAARIRESLDADFTLYAQRLQAAPILELAGFSEVYAEAALSGLIPVQLRRGRILSARAELHTQPGEAGVLRIGQADLLAAAMPPGGRAVGNMLFTRAALEHLRLDWMRILVDATTSGLDLALAVYGHPITPLPFRYDEKRATFVSLPETTTGGISTPIHIELNIRLPLPEIEDASRLLQLLAPTK